MNFKKLFNESTNAPSDCKYKKRHIFCADKFPIKNKDLIELSIERTNSQHIQGIAVGVYGRCKIAFDTHKRGKYIHLLLWEDSQILDPSCMEVQIFTKESFIYIQNIWEQYSLEGKKKSCYAGSSEWLRNRGNGAAMYSEEIKGGRRYFCNDGEENDDFDDIIFTVKNLGPPEKPLRLNNPRSSRKRNPIGKQ